MSKRLSISLYQPWIYLHGGLERSILELVSRSRHRWTIYTGYYDANGTFPEFRNLDVRQLGPTSVDRGIFSVLRSAVQIASQKIPVDNETDALVVWCDGIGDLATFRNRQRPIFNICSTPLRAVFDPSYEAQALGQRGLLGRFAYRVFREGFRFVDRLAWRNYDGVVATSREVEQRILRHRLYTRDRMVLCHPGIEWSPELPDVSYEPSILVPGRIMWTKNIQLAIEAFIKAKLPAPWKLKVAGYVDEKSGAYIARLRELANGRADIEFIESPTDEELRDLFRRTSFVLFTPLNEDWGIVPLEAMAQAKTVLAVSSGGPKESIAFGVSGYLLDPDPEIWGQAIASLAADPQRVRQLGQQAHAHVAKFTWDRFASSVDEAIETWLTTTQERRRPRRLRSRMTSGQNHPAHVLSSRQGS